MMNRQWMHTYYANDFRADATAEPVQHWTKLLLEHDPELVERVHLAYRQWNMPVRDLLRNETGLRLSTGDDVTQVPVKIVNGFPVPLLQVLEEYAEVADLLLHRRAVQDVNRGLGIVHGNYQSWLAHMPKDAVSLEQIAAVAKWIGNIDGFLDSVSFSQRFREIDEDYLGAYFFAAPRVELYWAVIGVAANQTGASVEGMTVVALAHELAHAYTHRGKDIDGIVWDTRVFGETDLLIIEGLAQFYTHVICTKLAARFPAALHAFNALMEVQSLLYNDFRDWKRDHEHRGEAVRLAMIETRRAGIREYGGFRDLLERSRV